MTGTPVVWARGLAKAYGEVRAVRGVDLEVRRGEAYGVLGPNGAGKTSTMRMVAAVSPRDGGELRVFGLDPGRDGARVRARLGVVPQLDRLDAQLSCWENVYVYGRYFGLSRRQARERTGQLLRFMALDGRADALVEQLSGGMKRRLSLARALINRPDLLLLDEPTTGLDPEVRQALWDHLLWLKDQGISVVLTTHDMAEAAHLCDRLAILNQGRVIAEGAPAELVARYASREVVDLRLAGPPDPAVRALLESLATRVHVAERRCALYTDAGDPVLRKIVAAGVAPESAVVRPGNLEDVYLRLAGGTLAGGR